VSRIGDRRWLAQLPVGHFGNVEPIDVENSARPRSVTGDERIGVEKALVRLRSFGIIGGIRGGVALFELDDPLEQIGDILS
jgi:hypothetical protein